MQNNQTFWSSFRYQGKSSLHDEVSNFILSGIRQRILKGGEKLPSLRELEKLWNINYFSIKLGTSILTQQGYLYKQQGRGMFVTMQPQILRHVIFYLASRQEAVGARLYSMVLRDIVAAKLRKMGILCTMIEDDRPAVEHSTPPPEISEAVAAGTVDAIIAFELYRQDKKWLYTLPLCKTSGMEPNIPDYSNVARYLKENHCCKPALIAPFEHKPGSSLLLETLEDNGISIHKQFLRPIYDEDRTGILWGECGYRLTRELLDRPERKRPDALIVYPDGAVQGAIQAILDLRVNVPADLKVVFHRNLELGYYCSFPAEYIDVKIEDSADQIIRNISGGCQMIFNPKTKGEL